MEGPVVGPSRLVCKVSIERDPRAATWVVSICVFAWVCVWFVCERGAARKRVWVCECAGVLVDVCGAVSKY